LLFNFLFKKLGSFDLFRNVRNLGSSGGLLDDGFLSRGSEFFDFLLAISDGCGDLINLFLDL